MIIIMVKAETLLVDKILCRLPSKLQIRVPWYKTLWILHRKIAVAVLAVKLPLKHETVTFFNNGIVQV